METINKEIENRIYTVIIADTIDEQERALSWHCYLHDIFSFPFKAKCILPVSTSPLKPGDIVEILSMDSTKNCEHELFVKVKWKNNEALSVPLKQLKGINVDEATEEAMNDWAYWVSQGFRF